MPTLRMGAIRAGLETLYFSGAHRLARPMLAGVGSILTFHRVRPPRSSLERFQPNRHLEISPGFLAEIVKSLRSNGVDIVSMDEAHRRLTTGDLSRRFTVLTFDDGYRDNMTFAWPILKRHGAPFTVYVASAFADGEGLLWWMALEAAIARTDAVSVTLDGEKHVFHCADPAAKLATWRMLHKRFCEEASEGRMRAAVREIAANAGVDPGAQCRGACMSWDELGELAQNELVTIGAHTVRHPVLSRLGPEEAHTEITGSRERIGAKLGLDPRHFAYPVGNPTAAGPREFALAAEAGFRTAVTTRPGILFSGHAQTLTALPRVSVNGEFQRVRYLDVLLSGAGTALWNRFRRINAV